MPEKKEVNLSRRNLFVGAFRRLRGEMDQGRPQARSSETLPILEVANTAFAAGDFLQAAAKFKELLHKDPNNNAVRRRLGCCLYREAKFVQAKVEFERVLRINRDDNEAWLYLGLTLARGDNPVKAASVWKNFKDMRNIPLVREINLQSALLEQPEPPDGTKVADAVESVMGAPIPIQS